MDIEYRLGSTYDQDFDFVEQYVHYVNDSVSNKTKDERLSLEKHYISRLLYYKSRLMKYLNEVSDPDFISQLQSLESVYEELFGRYSLLYNTYDTDIINKYSHKHIIKLLKIIPPRIDKEIDKLEREFTIERVQRTFVLISYTFCLKEDPVAMSKFPEDSYGPITYSYNFCFLPNGNGLFGLNTWLYAYFNEFQLIGIPVTYMSFDRSKNQCPGRFVLHDFNHVKQINATINSDRKKFYRNLYHKILSDSKLDILQKELLILGLWILCHEGLTAKDDFFTSVSEFYNNIFNVPDFFDEYNRFRDLILDQELLTQFHEDIGDYSTDYRKYITPKSLNQYRDIIDSQNISIDKRTEMLGRLIMYYFREFCNKYYF